MPDPYADLMNVDLRDELIGRLRRLHDNARGVHHRQAVRDPEPVITLGLTLGQTLLIIGALERDNREAGERSSAAIEVNRQHVAIWSYQHNAWWGHNSMGYVADPSRAGAYRRDDAEGICTSANRVCHKDHPNERIVETDDMESFQAREMRA